jgi:hypothetical protein
VFLPPGQPEDAVLFAYVQHALLSAILPRLCFDVLPSSLCSLLLQTAAGHEEAVDCSPLFHEDVRVDLMCHDHASSTRYVDQLVALSVQNYPLTHWGDRYI